MRCVVTRLRVLPGLQYTFYTFVVAFDYYGCHVRYGSRSRIVVAGCRFWFTAYRSRCVRYGCVCLRLPHGCGSAGLRLRLRGYLYRTRVRDVLCTFGLVWLPRCRCRAFWFAAHIHFTVYAVATVTHTHRLLLVLPHTVLRFVNTARLVTGSHIYCGHHTPYTVRLFDTTATATVYIPPFFLAVTAAVPVHTGSHAFARLFTPFTLFTGLFTAAGWLRFTFTTHRCTRLRLPWFIYRYTLPLGRFCCGLPIPPAVRSAFCHTQLPTHTHIPPGCYITLGCTFCTPLVAVDATFSG